MNQPSRYSCQIPSLYSNDTILFSYQVGCKPYRTLRDFTNNTVLRQHRRSGQGLFNGLFATSGGCNAITLRSRLRWFQWLQLWRAKNHMRMAHKPQTTSRAHILAILNAYKLVNGAACNLRSIQINCQFNNQGAKKVQHPQQTVPEFSTMFHTLDASCTPK